MDPVLVVVPTDIQFSIDSDDGPVELDISRESTVPLAFLNISHDANGINILLPGDAFTAKVNFIQINLTITAIDLGNAMAQCNITLEIELFEASVCVNEHLPFPGILVALSSVTIVVSQDMVRHFSHQLVWFNSPI